MSKLRPDGLRKAGRPAYGYPERRDAQRPSASTTMRRVAAWCHDRRRIVIGVWLTAFVALAALWGTAAGD